MQTDDPAAVAYRDDTARGTTRQYLAGLDVEHHGAVVTGVHIDAVDAVDTEEFIGPGAP